MIDIKELTYNEIENLVVDLGEPKFRAKQIFEWLYSKQAQSFSEMTNIPEALRKSLSDKYFINSIIITDSSKSKDKTEKFVLSSKDGVCFETVAIPSESTGLTVCVSTQAGCKMGCKFCATGKQKFYRNLNIGEIVDQVLIVQRNLGKRVNNVVVMGQGEPFLNYSNLIEALTIINNPKLVGIGARHITISTCGILPGITKLSKVNKQFGLAISLHSCNQPTRDQLMPGVKSYTINKLRESVVNYINATGRRVTFEYVLLDGVNDSEKDLVELVKFCNGLLCHINILTYNPVADCCFSPAPAAKIKEWTNFLRSNGIPATGRISRGQDVNGACGQLINKHASRL